MAEKVEKKKRRISRKWTFLLWVIGLFPLAVIALMLYFASQSDLPDTAALANPKTNLATEVISSDGKVLGRFYLENRTNAEFDQLSPHLVEALIATEDERFYDHSGIDLKGTARAAIYLGKRGGASTITQQLAKMLFTGTPANGLERVFQKFQEWIIAVELERRYTKNEILTLYLNRFDWINQAVGIRSAADIYFNSTPDSLRIEQAAMLVGMAKNPALFNPLRRPDTTLHRRNVVLGQMVRNEFITKDEYDSLTTLPLGLNVKSVDHQDGPAPYFREILRAELKELFDQKDENGTYVYAKANGEPYNIYSDGLKIYTTIDSRLQEYAEQAVAKHLGGELQEQFRQDISNYRNPPFSNDLSPDEIKGIENLDHGISQKLIVYAGHIVQHEILQLIEAQHHRIL